MKNPLIIVLNRATDLINRLRVYVQKKNMQKQREEWRQGFSDCRLLIEEHGLEVAKEKIISELLHSENVLTHRQLGKSDCIRDYEKHEG